MRDLLREVSFGLRTPVLIGIGFAAALGLTRFLEGFLHGVSSTDPFTLVASAVLLFLVAMIACYWPARRATQIDPAIALRWE